MENKTVYLTESQLREAYHTIMQEALVVNIDLVKMVVKYLDAHFQPVKYDDINADGEVVQPYAIQVLSADREPLQTISVDKLLDKVDSKFQNKIKDDYDRRKFFKQVIEDWVKGKISKDGVLSVNVIKEELEKVSK